MNPDMLPDGAEFVEGGARPVVRVDTHEAYPAVLSDLAELYADASNLHPDWLKQNGEPRAEWQEALENLDPEEPTAYWVEVARQIVKQDIWVANGGMTVLIRLKDADLRYAEERLEEGRGAEMAGGGVEGPRENVDHYSALRGYTPAGVKA